MKKVLSKRTVIGIVAVGAACAVALILFFSLRRADPARQESEKTFAAVVCQIRDGSASFLAAPVLDSDEIRSSDLVTVSAAAVDSPGPLKAGDLVMITYSGEILEIYPASLSGVTKVTYAGSVAENEAESDRFVVFEDALYLKNNLSPETLEWIEAYGKLDEAEKAAALTELPEELAAPIGYVPIGQ